MNADNSVPGYLPDKIGFPTHGNVTDLAGSGYGGECQPSVPMYIGKCRTVKLFAHCVGEIVTLDCF